MIMENITDTFHEEISTDEKNSMNINGGTQLYLNTHIQHNE